MTINVNLGGDVSEADSLMIEQALILGDMSGLSPSQRTIYYMAVCDSLKLNPLTTPFAYTKLDGKTILYPRKQCAEQLRNLHGVSTIDTVITHDEKSRIYMVTVTVRDREGRLGTDIGAVPLFDDRKLIKDWRTKKFVKNPDYGKDLEGVARCNAMKKSLSQALRRATFALVGLGEADEDDIASARQCALEDAYRAGGKAKAKVSQIDQILAQHRGEDPVVADKPALITAAVAEEIGVDAAVEIPEELEHPPEAPELERGEIPEVKTGCDLTPFERAGQAVWFGPSFESMILDAEMIPWDESTAVEWAKCLHTTAARIMAEIMSPGELLSAGEAIGKLEIPDKAKGRLRAAYAIRLAELKKAGAA